MNKFMALVIALLVSQPAFSAIESRIALKEGENRIDLNNDGIPDIVFSATYDNNTSHPSQTLTVFIRRDNNWFIVPLPDGDGFTWADFRLSASTLKIDGFELHRDKGTLYLIRAAKYAGKNGISDLTDQSQVTFSRYRMAESHDDPGISLFHWEPAGSYISDMTFNDVDDAFQLMKMEKFR